MLNVTEDLFVKPLNDLAANNHGLFLEPLHDVFSDYPQLQELLVHGCDPNEGFYKKKLDGNGCVELLNNLPGIIERLLGVFNFDGGEADTALVLEEMAAHSEAVANEQRQRNAALAAQVDRMQEAASKASRTTKGRAPAYYTSCAHGLGVQVTVPRAQVHVLPADSASAVAMQVCRQLQRPAYLHDTVPTTCP